MNAKQELLDHIGSRQVEYVVIDREHDDHKSERIEGRLNDVLEKLDFEYDNGYGAQYLTGTIWYTDGTWSERGEYDGSEWWEHKERPPLPSMKVEPTDEVTTLRAQVESLEIELNIARNMLNTLDVEQ
jgi:hypothetical protein